MTTRHALDTKALRKLAPGEWIWSGGVGYRADTRGSGSWYIKYRAPAPGTYPVGTTAPKRIVKERLDSCRNRSQAEGVLMARRSAVFEGIYAPRRRLASPSIAEFAPVFLNAKRHLRTVDNYRRQIERRLVPHFGRRPIAAITVAECQEFYNGRLDGKGAIATANLELACLKALLSEAVRAGLRADNPARAVRLRNPNNARDRLLSSDETARLFAAAALMPDYMRPLFHALFHTGMRKGEALGLCWADVELDHQRIVLRDSKTGEGRKIPVRDTLADELIRWKPMTHGSPWVFPGAGTGERALHTFRKGWLRLCKAAEVVNLTPHDLRHNFVSQLQARGISDTIIMSITGHKTLAMLKRYSHATDALRQAAVAALPDVPRSATEGVLRFRSAQSDAHGAGSRPNGGRSRRLAGTSTAASR